MSWQKSSDGAATHPKLMKIEALPEADERLLNEARGWLWALSTQSAQHDTDYYVEVGVARMFGGSRTAVLIEVAKRVGLLTEHVVDGLRVYKLLEDENLWHIRLKAEKEWEAQQRDDVKDPALKVPVVRRDGDNCRYCGVLTQWRGPRHHATFTLDHRVPGQAATVDTMVVACWRCNTSRSSNPQWDDDHPLRPAPTHPLYGKWAARYLTENGYRTAQNVQREDDDERPAPALADTAPQSVRPATAPSAGPARSPRSAVSPESAREVESDSSPTHKGATPGVTRVGSGQG
uniref:HNH endonuclease n=1 Tax=Cellulomonas sp. HZM TaxID=1454010 RepID=UPI0004935731